MTRGFSANLDVLRAIAVMLVLLQHLLLRFHVKQIYWLDTSCLGYFGVLLFFVHTTLVLMFSLERHHDGIFKSFYIRRLFRIYPLAILAVCAALVLRLDSGVNGVAGLSRAPFPGPREVLGNLLLIQNLVQTRAIVNVLWSLPFELQMYIFIPVIFLLARRKWAVIGLWPLSLPLAWKFSLFQFWPCFLPGAIAYTLTGKTARLPSWLWPIFILGLLGIFSIRPILYVGWALCFCLGILLPFFAEIQSSTVRLIAGKIATYSYGIYISHQFCIWFATDVLYASAVWVKCLFLLITICGLPILLYHYIEKPFIDFGKQFSEVRKVA